MFAVARHPTHRRALLLGLGLLASYAYFYQAGGWNQNSRFALTRALVEHGTVRIDAYEGVTGDQARVGDHLYSDKAPGQSLLAVPVVAAARLLAAPGDEGVPALSYLATVFAASLPGALAGVLLFYLACLLRFSRTAASLTALLLGLGTPALCYGTLFMGHSLAMACLLAGFVAACCMAREPTRRALPRLAAAAGLALGAAVITEYTAGPPALAVALLAVSQAPPGRARLRAALALGAAALAALSVLMGYHWLAFGSVFTTPLQHLDLFPTVRADPFGWPSLDALFEILVGSRRGLLRLAPALALAPLGLLVLGRRLRRSRVTIVAAGIVAYYVLLNTAFATPLGGWGYGPRYLSAALPFLCLAVGALWDLAPPLGKRLGVTLGLYGVGAAFIAVSTTAQAPESFEDPMAQLHVPAFLDGDLSLNHQSFLEDEADPDRLRGGSIPHDAWNLGERLGLRGHASLLPLGLVWLALLAASRRRRPTKRDGPPPETQR